MSASTQWHYGRDGQQHGPVTEDELQRLVANGELRPNDLVWNPSMPNWSPAAGALPALFPNVQPPPMQSTVHYATPQRRSAGDDAGMRMLLPVGRSGWAIAAGYLGLLSVLLVFAPFALICGIIAVVVIQKNPEKRGMGRAIFGIAMGGIFTVALIAAVISAFVA